MGPKSITRYGERFGLLLFKVDRRRRRIEVSARRMCVCAKGLAGALCVSHACMCIMQMRKTQNNITAAVIMHKRPWGI